MTSGKNEFELVSCPFVTTRSTLASCVFWCGYQWWLYWSFETAPLDSTSSTIQWVHHRSFEQADQFPSCKSFVYTSRSATHCGNCVVAAPDSAVSSKAHVLQVPLQTNGKAPCYAASRVFWPGAVPSFLHLPTYLPTYHMCHSEHNLPSCAQFPSNR